MGTLTVRLKFENRQKLTRLANEHGVTPNRLLNMLIENAVMADVVVIKTVQREPVAVIGGEHDQRAATVVTGN